MISAHVQTASTPAPIARNPILCHLPSTSRSSSETFHWTDYSTFRKTPISKRGRSDGLNTPARSCPRPPKSGPDSWEQCNEQSTQQNSCQYQSRDLDEPSCERRDSEGRHHEFAVLSERSEQSVFADLRGSDSAIDITKKVC